MSVRFKFRSSVNFDSVDIQGRPSISVSDLKSKIIRNKNLNICQDFDLVFSDAVTGREYRDENLQISSGSSVIIKRVPAGSLPCHNMARVGSFGNFGTKDTSAVKASIPVNVETIDFDDFGADLCPLPEGTLSGYNLDVDKKISEKTNAIVPRCLEPPTAGCQKHEPSPAHSGIEENMPETQAKPNVAEPTKLEKAVNANPLALQNADLPSELKCSLCDSFFKEAVMIPCCQHSFCDKCIRLVLVEKARCPKCFSTKCRVEDLLPNVSLRQAIEHFLESQILINGSENAFHRYAPDGESGIQVKDVSCAVSILQREPEFPHSPSATGRGSNQIIAESAFGPPFRNNATVGAKSRPEDLAAFADFQGESQPMHEQVIPAESSIKKKRALWVNTADVDKSYMQTGRHKKGKHTCYVCGSPDHFIRECPAASNPHPMLQTGNAMFPGALSGYVSPYWNGTPLPHVRPFPNIYGNPGMMPFNASMVAATRFTVPTFMPSMFGSLPSYSGFMKMGGMATPAGNSSECHLSRSEFSDLQDCEKRRKFSNDNLRREQSCNDEDDDFNKRCCYNEAERSHECKPHIDGEKSVSYCEESFTQRSQRKHRRDNHVDDDVYSVGERQEKSSRSSFAGRDRRSYHHSERSSSVVEDMPSSSNCHGEGKHKHHHRKSKKHKERREQCGSDSSWSRHPTNREKDVKRKSSKSDVERHIRKQHKHSDSGLEPSFASDQEKQQIEKDYSLGSRHSRHSLKAMNNELSHDRWQMISGSDEYGREDYHYHKWKRVY